MGDRDEGIGGRGRSRPKIAPLLRPDDVVMAFQNGLGAGERVARQVPEEHVVIGIAEGFGSSIPEPGHVHHAGMRLIRLGEMHGGLSDRVQHIEQTWREARVQRQGVRRHRPDDLGEVPLQRHARARRRAAFDVTVGELMANSEAWAVAIGCMLEAWQVGQAQGVQFGFDDPVRYVTEFAATIPDASPSMRLDHLARRRSEVDVINGAVVDLSRELGLEAPYNETLCAILRERESRFD